MFTSEIPKSNLLFQKDCHWRQATPETFLSQNLVATGLSMLPFQISPHWLHLAPLAPSHCLNPGSGNDWIANGLTAGKRRQHVQFSIFEKK